MTATASLMSWAGAHPLPAALVAVVVVTAVVVAVRGTRRGLRRIRWRAPAAVVTAAVAAVACTAYSADTSWRFAAHSLDMASTVERAAMFFAAELALFSCALMARQNLNQHGAPGTPGVLVWGITGVQVIPAYAESGVVGGTVRAVVGPILAAVLWHLAMGIELRHAKPGAGSQSLPAVIAREVRERLLSWLGLATRDRTAEQITRDRWTARAVDLAARLSQLDAKQVDGRSGRRLARRLSIAVGHAGVGSDGEQRDKLLAALSARRHAAALATVALPSPWDTGTGTAAAPGTGTGTGPAALPRLVPVPVEVPIVPALAPVPLPEHKPVPVPAARPVRKRVTASAKVSAKPRRTGTTNGSTGAKFHTDVEQARAWLAADPDITGTDIGTRLGTGDSYGRRVRRAAGGTAK